MRERQTAECNAPDERRDVQGAVEPLSRAPTIADVARTAGVSRSTVSRVLNGSSALSEESRNAVLESMASLNYVPNEHARQLARRSTPRSREARADVSVTLGARP
ncbi:LacI family DNA-binding transcriptional regulator [Microbacterium sp.]|uniref:LacI family DNA-binding transcriptional regulator n=1 Tax=Microbacterium sp. TaxID=51671 RepID=UPI0028112FE9|nr:LacI family DNA-binding transcriptional regulator [Microbacterium sp.]